MNEIKKEDLMRAIRAEMGRAGGNVTKSKHGKDHYSQIAKQMWAKRRLSTRPKKSA